MSIFSIHNILVPNAPIYNYQLFKSNYKMKRLSFLKIMKLMLWHLFHISNIKKCSATLQMIAYGVITYVTNEYCHFGESTTMAAMECSM
jgi:hypothetical protein